MVEVKKIHYLLVAAITSKNEEVTSDEESGSEDESENEGTDDECGCDGKDSTSGSKRLQRDEKMVHFTDLIEYTYTYRW